MKFNYKILNVFDNIVFWGLLFIIAGQMYITFLKYEEKFENPIKFINQNYGNDYITQYGNRFEEIKKMFPTPTHLTYIGGANESSGIATFNYVLTQYFLSPNLVFKDNNIGDTLIYNLSISNHIDPATNFLLNNGWHVVKDFNNGLIILAK